MVAQLDGRSLAYMADVFGGMSMCSGLNPPFLAFDIFQLGKGVALLGIESTVCCAAQHSSSDLRMNLGFGCCTAGAQSAPWNLINGPASKRSRGWP